MIFHIGRCRLVDTSQQTFFYKCNAGIMVIKKTKWPYMWFGKTNFGNQLFLPAKIVLHPYNIIFIAGVGAIGMLPYFSYNSPLVKAYQAVALALV